MNSVHVGRNAMCTIAGILHSTQPELGAALMEGRRCFSTYVANIALFSPLSISALPTIHKILKFIIRVNKNTEIIVFTNFQKLRVNNSWSFRSSLKPFTCVGN